MRRKMLWIVPAAILGIVAFAAIGGYAVMFLWNWLLPGLFSWRSITFWQALGLLALCRILFGNIGGKGRRPNFRRRMGERWQQMTPEEREKFRQGWRSRCGPWEPPKAEGTA